MGWYGIKADFRNVQEYAAQELKIDSKFGFLLDRAYYGNTVYSLIARTDNNEKYIHIDLVQNGADGFWAHKPISENSGPYHYDCPERILKQSTSQNIHAVEWREQCRQIRRDKAELIKIFKAMPKGIIITTEYGRKLKFLAHTISHGPKSFVKILRKIKNIATRYQTLNLISLRMKF